jgi:hypothetical protein
MTRAYKHWTHREVAALRSSAPTAALAKRLGRSKIAVRAKARMLGLAPVQRPWTQAERDKLFAEYHQKSAKQLSREMGRTVTAIYNTVSRSR